MPDRRRQRHQRTRQDAGQRDDPVGASNRNEVWPKPAPEQAEAPRGEQRQRAGVSYEGPKEYERVTIMPDKESPSEPQKYHRRAVISNWSRYEELPPDTEPEEGEDYMIGEDFSKILEQQANSGGGGYMKLKGEKLWDEAETGILTSHGLGALNVADLVAAFNTIPLHEQLNIPEEMLPKSLVESYKNFAQINSKVYKPASGHKDSLDINEKIIQSLKISEDEPLTLANEEVEDNVHVHSAVDVALTLSSDFAPEPEDVDLDTLIREPSPEKRPSPVKEMPRRVKEPTPVKEYSPMRDFVAIKDPSPMKEFSPVKDVSPIKEISPFKEISPIKEISPVKDISPPKESNPIQNVSFVKDVNSIKENSPDKEVPSFSSNETIPELKQPKLEEPKFDDVVSPPKERRRNRRESNVVRENREPINEMPKEKSPMPLEKQSKPKEKSPMPLEKQPKPKEKSPKPLEKQAKEKEKSPRPQEKQPKEKVKEKSPAALDFNMPKKVKEKSPALDFNMPKKVENSDSPMSFNFGLSKASTTLPPELKKKTKEEKKEFELPAPLKLEEKEEAVPEGPVIDLDAPVKAEKPVLLLSKTEADDLEDWLDSVLDD